MQRSWDLPQILWLFPPCPPSWSSVINALLQGKSQRNTFREQQANIRSCIWASLVVSGKEPTCQCRRYKFDPWVRKIPWRRERQPVFLLGESHGQRNLAGYSSWSYKESDRTEWLNDNKRKTHLVIHLSQLDKRSFRKSGITPWHLYSSAFGAVMSK